MERVAVYVDGFNLFFGIRSRNPKAVNFDVTSYVRSRLGTNQLLSSVRYYSAPLVGNPEAERAQKRYFAGLRASHVEVILGRFQQKTIHCEHCGQSIPSFEEKMTDVHIAVDVLADGLLDRYDVAILVTADSDLVPPIRKLNKFKPNKRILIIFPPNRFAAVLKSTAHGVYQIRLADLAKHQIRL